MATDSNDKPFNQEANIQTGSSLFSPDPSQVYHCLSIFIYQLKLDLNVNLFFFLGQTDTENIGRLFETKSVWWRRGTITNKVFSVFEFEDFICFLNFMCRLSNAFWLPNLLVLWWLANRERAKLSWLRSLLLNGNVNSSIVSEQTIFDWLKFEICQKSILLLYILKA